MIYIDYNWHLQICETNQYFSVDQQNKLKYADYISYKSDQ